MIRLSKQHWFVLGCVATAGLTTLVIAGGIWVTHTKSAQTGNTLARCQNAEPAMYTLTLTNNTFHPTHVSAHICEVLTIINKNPTARDVAFGTPDKPLTYAGVSNRRLPSNQSYAVRLTRLGTFVVRDQKNSAIQATFSVSR